MTRRKARVDFAASFHEYSTIFFSFLHFFWEIMALCPWPPQAGSCGWCGCCPRSSSGRRPTFFLGGGGKRRKDLITSQKNRSFSNRSILETISYYICRCMSTVNSFLPRVLLCCGSGEPVLRGRDAQQAAPPSGRQVQHVVVGGVDGAEPDAQRAQGEEAGERPVAELQAVEGEGHGEGGVHGRHGRKHVLVLRVHGGVEREPDEGVEPGQPAGVPAGVEVHLGAVLEVVPGRRRGDGDVQDEAQARREEHGHPEPAAGTKNIKEEGVQLFEGSFSYMFSPSKN